jgi:small subunit ribosomal protein S1
VEKYPIGSKIKGKVRNLTDFGAFVEVEEGIDGLIHISDLSWNKRVKHPSEVLKKGDDVEAVILKIDTENQRLSLGLKQLAPNAYDDFFAIHRVGEILDGKIARLTDFGAFVELEEGVEGLVHISEIARERVENAEDHIKTDQAVRVKIIRLEPQDKKIGLSIKAVADGEEADMMSTYQSSGSGGGASLGEISAANAEDGTGKAKKPRKSRATKEADAE